MYISSQDECHQRPPLTDHDGVVGDLLGVAPVVVKRQVPDARVQVLDEARLVHVDRAGVSGSAPGFVLVRGGRVRAAVVGVAERSLVFGNEATAVQELHKVVLGDRNTPFNAIVCNHRPREGSSRFLRACDRKMGGLTGLSAAGFQALY